jgi:GGDEF domain-containing protein
VRDQTDRPSSDGTAPAERLARAARAAQQLCDALWDALHDELRHPDAERVTALSERLADVSSTVAMLAASAPPTGAPSAAGSGAVAPDPAGPRAAAPSVVAPRAGAPQAGPPQAVAPDTPAAPYAVPPQAVAPDTPAAPDAPAVERRTPPAPSPADPPPPVALQSIPTRAGSYTFTKLVDEQESPPPEGPLASVESIQPEIEIRDVRREEGPSAWVSSVGRLLARHAEDGLPFAVLLVEIVDVARLERSETPHELHGLVAKVESALGRGMRATDRLSRETLGRYWLVAPETNGTGARMLAERLARLVRTSATHHGVPLEVAIGIAVCPDDGTEAPALAARADLGVYSARATGRSISHTDPPPAS